MIFQMKTRVCLINYYIYYLSMMGLNNTSLSFVGVEA